MTNLRCIGLTGREAVHTNTVLSKLDRQRPNHSLDGCFTGIVYRCRLHRNMYALRRERGHHDNTSRGVRLNKMPRDQFRRPECPHYVDVKHFAAQIPAGIDQLLIDTDACSREGAVELALCFDGIVEGGFQGLLVCNVGLVVGRFDAISIC